MKKNLSISLSFCFFIFHGCCDNDKVKRPASLPIKKDQKLSSGSEKKKFPLRKFFEEDFIPYKWSQVMEGKELKDVWLKIKEDKPLDELFQAGKFNAEDNAYTLNIKHYDEGSAPKVIAEGIYTIDEKDEIVKKATGEILMMEQEDANHISFNLKGKKVRFFKTPENIEELLGNWEIAKEIPYKHKETISDDLVTWREPLGFTEGNYSFLLRDKKIDQEYGFITDYDAGKIHFEKRVPSLENINKNSIEIIKMSSGKSDSKCRIYILDYYENADGAFLKTLIWWGAGKNHEGHRHYEKVKWKKQQSKKA